MAAIIPGLGSIDSASGGPGPNFNVRPDAPDSGVRTPQLSPVASPVDTFIRPPEPASQAGNLSRIADALSAFQPALASYSQTQHILEQQQTQQVTAKYVGANPQQLQQGMQTDPMFQNEMARRFGMQLLGNKVAEATRSEMLQRYADGTFDRSNGDFEGFTNGFAQRDMKAYGNDPWFAKGYAQTFDTARGALLNEQARFKMDQTKMQQDDLLSSTFSNAISNGVAKGQDANAVYQAIAQTMGTNKLISNRPMSEQQTVLMGSIEKAAEGLYTDPNWDKTAPLLKQMLTMDRGTAPDGTKLGSLVQSSVVGGKASDLLQKVQQITDNRFGMDNFGPVADVRELAKRGDPAYKDAVQKLTADHPYLIHGGYKARMDGMFEDAVAKAQAQAQGNEAQNIYSNAKMGNLVNTVLPALQNHDPSSVKDFTVLKPEAGGKLVPETITREDQIKQAASARQQQLDQLPEGPQKQAAEHDLWVLNGIKNPQWESALGSGFSAASTMTAAGSNIGQATLTGYQTYRRLEAVSPSYVGSIVGGKAAQFYRMASAGEDSGLDRNTALSVAAKAINSDHPENFPFDNTIRNEVDVENAVRRTLPGTWNPFGTGLRDASNSSMVVQKVKDDALLLVHAYNMDPQKAIEQASAKLIPNFKVVNGSAIDTSGHEVPPNFEDLSNRFLGDWWKANGKAEQAEGHEMSDLTIRQVNGTPNWMLVYKNGWQPHGDPSFSIGDLGTVQAAITAEKRGAARAALKATSDDNAVKNDILRQRDAGEGPSGPPDVPLRTR